MVKPLVVLPPVVFAALAGLFFFGMNREDPDALPSAIAGQPAPPMQLTPLGDGEPFTDAALREPGVKLVNYWASWCAPCRVEHPNLEALADEGLPIYGINYKDDPEKAMAFLRELGNPYTALAADSRGKTALDWGVYGVPETYVIDGDGKVVLRFAGPVTQRVIEERLRPAIEAAAE
ncbi:DsbE family thiol:disulfide interchange protein [Psychromarinibacter sp. C21-152]|uniref:DsbE family thiol:disulfide interchange protein n=1 Tax=Psychromarinibacter sediminicola TaxID=3033385 RepID=A0AAE3T9Q7_9RHOB|nr:DsbE family thiol:disulfide interchange protein [Psychromarinibacter sediminicola]MDF0602497.1 DsbE family thiol:disulfide interchange protein [Psychromarinibacter sediminicola]